jgi:hypothetical protein
MRHLPHTWALSMGVIASFTLALSLPLPSLAANVTRIASAFDEKDPFDLDIEVGFTRTQKRSKITQEYYGGGRIADVLALRYSEITNEMPLSVKVGLFQDLELSVGTSIVFSNTREWRLPVYADYDKREKFDPASSTILNNRLDRLGNSLELPDPIIDLDQNNASYRSGFGNISLGLRWAPFNETRDQYLPTWVLGFNWTIPTASISDPSQRTSSNDPGSIGDGVHRFTFSTAFSRQLGVFDPYLSAWYSFPLGASSRYDNCDLPEALAFGDNCSTIAWSKDEVALDAPHVGGFFVGTEIIPWEDKVNDQKISIDIRAGASYRGKGRTYNELTDALGKLLWTEGYATLGGSIAINAQPVRYVFLRLEAGLYHETSHYLTGETTGKHLDDVCPNPDFNGPCVDLSQGSLEANPNFDYRYDVPGRRFRVTETNLFTLSFTGRIQF